MPALSSSFPKTRQWAEKSGPVNWTNVAAFQHGGLNGGRAGKRMISAHDKGHGHRRQRKAGQIVVAFKVVDSRKQERAVRPIVVQLIDLIPWHSTCVSLDAQRHSRIDIVQQRFRIPYARIERRVPDDAADTKQMFSSEEPLHMFTGKRVLIPDAFGIIEKKDASVCEVHSVAIALEQRNAVKGLKGGDVPAEGRLRQAKARLPPRDSSAGAQAR